MLPVQAENVRADLSLMRDAIFLGAFQTLAKRPILAENVEKIG